ncbi:hypothetical protein GUITHDRAFT_104758 [Guillardia theta CCMP2712]|uniref:Uncharacterized protein n=1 Tax=Guillardia theta (strain CCMP2712) TaxID=905079 RepID=L1JL42_GUITC|nr:hypothetical protein GUITHDRAFT_104758 [Guillardia theta CCMP2712]EKX49228.1 hypothetical protein GUITHDRAFT_104758 [Guillardia theta CCMP2712]|eukprot:XP_005836208.1 hypothetical protein GUITHDRAFT_104758 [Guillardia theta CCMP2712]
MLKNEIEEESQYKRFRTFFKLLLVLFCVTAAANSITSGIMSLEQDILTAEKRNEEGNLLYRNKRFDEACSQYSDAIVLLELHAQQTQEAHQHLCKYLSNRAAAYLASGYDAEAVKDCTSALAMDPMLDKALLRRGLGLESLGRHAESLQDVEALLKRADWGSPIATKGLELKRRLQRVLNQVTSNTPHLVPHDERYRRRTQRNNRFFVLTSALYRHRKFQRKFEYITNVYDIYWIIVQSDLACIEVSMIGDDPEVKLEVKNDNNVGSITPFSTGLAGCMSGRGIDLPHLDSAVVILENPDSGIPGKIWDGGLILTEYLSSSSHEVQGKSCLELGAGTGIVGVSCYCLGAARVTITDLHEHV